MQLYLDVGLLGLSQCPAVSIEKSVSRVGAKNLDNFFRQLSFRIYTLIADFKQEVDLAVKSEAFKLREHRYLRLISMFIQRSSNDRWLNTGYLGAVVSGNVDSISCYLIHLFSLAFLFSNFSVIQFMKLTF